MEQTAAFSESNLQYGHYFVAFIDVLGQSERLQHLRRPFQNREEFQETIEVLRGTAGVVMSLRDSFKGFFKSWMQTTGQLDVLSPEMRALAEELRKIHVEIRGISDSIIITVPLVEGDTVHRCLAVQSVQATMFGLCGTFALTLCGRHPIRGGFDVGLGLRIAPEEVYGPVIRQAYCLESNVAQYPRIVAGDGIRNFLSEIKSQPKVDIFSETAIQVAGKCMDLLFTDTDGLLVLDWLGPAASPLANHLKGCILSGAYRFAKESHQDYVQRGDQKHAERYERLLNYMEKRMHLWEPFLEDASCPDRR